MKIQAKIWKAGFWYFKFRNRSYSFSILDNNNRCVVYANGDKLTYSDNVNIRKMNRHILKHLSLVCLLKELQTKIDDSKLELHKL